MTYIQITWYLCTWENGRSIHSDIFDMFENNLIHNLLIYSRWLRPVVKNYIRVHDGKACITSSVCRQTVQGRPVGWSESGGGGVLFQGSGTPKGRGSGGR